MHRHRVAQADGGPGRVEEAEVRQVLARPGGLVPGPRPGLGGWGRVEAAAQAAQQRAEFDGAGRLVRHAAGRVVRHAAGRLVRHAAGRLVRHAAGRVEACVVEGALVPPAAAPIPAAPHMVVAACCAVSPGVPPYGARIGPAGPAKAEYRAGGPWLLVARIDVARAAAIGPVCRFWPGSLVVKRAAEAAR